jgi:hypothetical protein
MTSFMTPTKWFVIKFSKKFGDIGKFGDIDTFGDLGTESIQAKNPPVL